MKIKNEHLIPNNVKDIAEQLESPILRREKRDYHLMRIEAIKEFCEYIIKKQSVNSR